MTGDKSEKPWFAGFGGLIGISIGLAAIAWVLDSILDSVIFHEGTLLGHLLSPTVNEIGVRVLFGFVIIVFGTYTQLNMDRRKQVEESLLQSEEKYRMLVENILEGVFIIQDAKFQYVNDALVRTTGYNVGEIIGRNFREFVAPDDLEMVADRYYRRQAGENVPSEYEFHMMRKDGAKIVVNMNVGLVTYRGRVASLGILKDITEQKRAEKALEEAVAKAVEEKNKSNAIIAALGDGIIIQDTDYKIIYQNQVQNDLFGNRIGEYCYKAYEGRDTICEWCPVEITFRDGKIHRTDREVNTESGTIYYELISSPLRDSTGKIIAGVKVVRNITERKRAEEKLREGEQFLASIFESIQDGIGIIDKDMNVIHVNTTTERWYPHTSRFIGRKCYEVYHSRSERCETCPAWRTLKTGKSAHDVVPKHGPGGKEVGWAEIYSFPLFDTTTGQMKGVIEYVRDITERKRTEEALRESEAKYRRIVETAHEGIWVLDASAKTSYVNSRMAQMLGYTAEEMLGRHLFDFMDTDARIEAEKLLERREHGIIETHDFRFSRKDGTNLWTMASTNPIFDDKGQYVGALGMITDISERKQAEKEKDRLLKAIDNSTDGITISDEKDRYIYVNAAYAKTFGYAQEELVGKTWRKITPPEMITPTEKGLSGTMHNRDIGVFNGEVPGLRKDGSEIPTEVRGTALWGENDNYVGHICIVRDITERKKVEEKIRNYTRELEESNRMKELFTDIMHHDLLNPLTTANGFIELLKENETISRKKAYLETIERSLVKGMELIDSAMKFSRFESLKSIELEELDLKKIIEEVIEALTPMADNAGMEIVNRITLNTPVRANKIIEEVFSNLISNAIKYASSGKRIIVESEDKGESLQVRIIDFGEGIKESEKTMIFERFMRGGKTGVKGSGLGLAIAGKIMELHNGRIWVEDNPEGGAIFIVEIPK